MNNQDPLLHAYNTVNEKVATARASNQRAQRGFKKYTGRWDPKAGPAPAVAPPETETETETEPEVEPWQTPTEDPSPAPEHPFAPQPGIKPKPKGEQQSGRSMPPYIIGAIKQMLGL